MARNVNREIHIKLLEILKELERIATKNNLTYYLSYGSALGAVREGGFIPWDNDLDVLVTIDEYERFCLALETQIDGRFALFSNKDDNKYTALFSRLGLKNELHHKVHIDIFPMVGTPKGRFGKILFNKIAYSVIMINYMKRVNIKERLRGHKKAAIIVMIGKVLFLLVPLRLLEFTHNSLKKAFPIENSEYLYNICGSYGSKEFILKSWLGEGERLNFEGLIVPVPKEWDKYLTHIYGDYMTPMKTNYVQ